MLVSADTGTVASSLRQARLALRSAWYDAGLELLEGCEDWPAPLAEEAVVLKGETLGRRDPVGALEWLTGLDDVIASPAGHFAYELALGKAYANVRDLSSADSRYDAAAGLAHHVPAGAAALAYHRARVRWMRREFDPHGADLALAVTHPDPNVAAAAFAVRGWHHGSLGSFGEQKADFRRVLAYAAAPTEEPVDAQVLAVTCHSFARVAFETADAAAIEEVRRAYAQINWTSDVEVDRFQTLRVFGWDSFMRGESGQAQWAFKDARAMAPSLAWRVMAHLDRAFVARIARNEAWAVEELAEADRLACDVRWESTQGEERLALVTLAVLHTATNAKRAQRYAAMFSQLGVENVNPTLALSADRRAHGFAQYAQGRIDQTLGRREAAAASLSQAYALFDGLNYHYQAAMAASGLAEVTGDMAWRDAAMRHAGAYPGCPLAAMVDEALRAEEALPRELNPLQRQMVRAMWSGADTAELSRRFSRSAYTIERQVAAIYAAFGVASRAQLLEHARSRGVA